MCVLHIGIGNAGVQLDFIGDGHAVPDAVDGLGFQFKELIVPVNFNELAIDTQLGGNGLGKLSIKTGPVSAIILVIHGGVVGDAHNQSAFLLNVSQIRVGIFLGASCEEGQNGNEAKYKSDHLFHNTISFFGSGLFVF